MHHPGPMSIHGMGRKLGPNHKMATKSELEESSANADSAVFMPVVIICSEYLQHRKDFLCENQECSVVTIKPTKPEIDIQTKPKFAMVLVLLYIWSPVNEALLINN